MVTKCATNLDKVNSDTVYRTVKDQEIFVDGKAREATVYYDAAHGDIPVKAQLNDTKEWAYFTPNNGLGMWTTFLTGGLADFTGPAWLDGTKARPEYVLNAAQTQGFLSLVDVLDNFDADKTKKGSGDNYYDVHIEVDEISNDYDVEQLMDKMKRIIADDAMYRNVNAVDLGRR